MNTAVATIEQPSVLSSMANTYGMDKRAFEATLRATVMPANTTNEQAAAFLLVAREHKLNPFTKEIFAFPGKGGGIQPVVSVDGWMKLINSHPQFDGMKFTDALDANGNIVSVTCHMHRKDRAHPVEVTEYMSECKRETDTWKRWPARMLRHKSAIQASRYAFGFAGIMEPDEAERSQETEIIDAEPRPSFQEVCDKFGEDLDLLREHIEDALNATDQGIIRAALTEAVKIYYAIGQENIDAVWIAPSKAKSLGIENPQFTTRQREIIKSNDWARARNEYFRNKNAEKSE